MTGLRSAPVPWPGRSLAARHRLRVVVNLLNLSTPAGVLLAAVTRSRLAQGPNGLLLATGYTPRLPAAMAFTVGNVILCRGEASFLDSRPALLAHESRHSTQYAWLGPAFLPLYGLCAAYSFWRTGNPGSANPFERWAGLADGGYPPSGARRSRSIVHPTIRQN